MSWYFISSKLFHTGPRAAQDEQFERDFWSGSTSRAVPERGEHRITGSLERIFEPGSGSSRS